jgi:lysophospholipase L1-like esterase
MLASKCLLIPTSCVAAVLLNAFSAASPGAGPDSQPNRFDKKIAAFEAADAKSPPPKGAILFVGDSTFTRWNIHKDLPEYTIINRGFGGSQMSDLIHFTDRIVLPYKPRLIVVQEGGNDIQAGKSPEQLLSETKAFIKKVRASLPNTPIIIGSITPNVAHWSEIKTRKRADRIVKKYIATQKNVTYVNFFDPFLGANGKPRTKLFAKDQMHPSRAGYRLRAQILRPYLGPPDRKTSARNP